MNIEDEYKEFSDYWDETVKGNDWSTLERKACFFGWVEAKKRALTSQDVKQQAEKIKVRGDAATTLAFIDQIKNQIEHHREQEVNRSKVKDYSQAIYHDNRRGALEDLLTWIKSNL